YIISRNYKVIGISLTQERVSLGLYFVNLLRENGCKTHITLGGYLPTLAPEKTLDVFTGADSLVMNEGEQTFAELIQALKTGRSLEMPGLLTRDALRKGTFIPRPLIQDLDSLPFPDRPGQVGPSEVTWLYSSRGCNSHCTFCSIHVFYKNCGWRPRSADNVVEEIEYLVRKRGVREIQFCDDNFLCGRKGLRRAREIASAIIKRGLDISFTIECRLESVDRELFKLLKKAGLNTVLVGVESVDDKSLELFKKPRHQDLLERALDILDSLGIKVHLGFIMFNPTSTMASIRKNIRFLRSRFRLGKISSWEMFLCYTSILQPNTGTPLVDRLFKNEKLIETSPLVLEMRFEQPALKALLEIRNLLRYQIASFVYNVRSMFRTDRYSPAMVEDGEKLVDESHTLGIEILEYFTKKLDPSAGAVKNESRIQEKLLAKIDRLNLHAERYFKKYDKAVEFRFHGISENGNEWLYDPSTREQTALQANTLDLLYFWQYRYFRRKGPEYYKSDERAQQACQRLLKNNLLGQTPSGAMFHDTEISPFLLWDALEIPDHRT
ncbi:MAG: B12-binding domain-containing radical SAM protein, partial [Deltaproteobacteria bacterium]|nr:B12-binding domain-containing radical SAM protein [Deltaproteobacteria bacterium]